MYPSWYLVFLTETFYELFCLLPAALGSPWT
jgi:hypothetical protein